MPEKHLYLSHSDCISLFLQQQKEKTTNILRVIVVYTLNVYVVLGGEIDDAEGHSMGESNILWEERKQQRQSLNRNNVSVAMDTASVVHQTPSHWAHTLKRVGLLLRCI